MRDLKWPGLLLVMTCAACGAPAPGATADGGGANPAQPGQGRIIGPSTGKDDGGVSPSPDASGASPLSCSDLFDERVLQTYSVDISATEWASLVAEFNNIPAVLTGVEFQTWHPVTFHFGAETVTDAAIRLKGQSSWVQTVQLDQIGRAHV